MNGQWVYNPAYDLAGMSPEKYWRMDFGQTSKMKERFGFQKIPSPHLYHVNYSMSEDEKIKTESGIVQHLKRTRRSPGRISEIPLTYYSKDLFDWDSLTDQVLPKNPGNYFMSVDGWDWKLKPTLTRDWYKYRDEDPPIGSGKDGYGFLLAYIGLDRFRHFFLHAIPKKKMRILQEIRVNKFREVFGDDTTSDYLSLTLKTFTSDSEDDSEDDDYDDDDYDDDDYDDDDYDDDEEPDQAREVKKAKLGPPPGSPPKSP